LGFGPNSLCSSLVVSVVYTCSTTRDGTYGRGCSLSHKTSKLTVSHSSQAHISHTSYRSDVWAFRSRMCEYTRHTSSGRCELSCPDTCANPYFLRSSHLGDAQGNSGAHKSRRPKTEDVWSEGLCTGTRMRVDLATHTHTGTGCTGLVGGGCQGAQLDISLRDIHTRRVVFTLFL
jgi:hypothetical protein